MRPWWLLLALILAANVVVAAMLTAPLAAAASSSGVLALAVQEAEGAVMPALDGARRTYGPLLEAEAALEILRDDVASRSGSIGDVVSTLRAAIDAAGLQAERVNYASQPLPGLGLLQVQVELPVRGEYAQLRRFLRELLSGPMFAVVERVGATTPSRDARTTDLSMTLTLSAFTAAPPVAQEAPEVSAEPQPAAPRAPGDAMRLARALGEQVRKLPPPPGAVGELHLVELARELEPGGPVQRNLFAFAGAFSPRALAAAAAAEAAAEEEERVPFDLAPEPVMPWNLLGITRTLDGPLATLSNGPTVLLAREGEVLPDGLRVVRIDLEFVVIDAGNERTRLRLGKEKDE